MSRAVRVARDALSNRSAGEADELDLATETKPCKCKAESKPRLVYRPGKGYFWGDRHLKAGEPAHFGCDVRRG